MSDKTNNSAIRVYEIMKEKSYTPEEIEAFLAFLDQRVIGGLKRRIDFYAAIILVAVLINPSQFGEMVKRIFGG